MTCLLASILSGAGKSPNLTVAGFKNCSTGNDDSAKSKKILLLFILLPIVIFTILGNLLIVVAVAYFRRLQTSTNAFIVSLATADFLVGLLVMPFSLVRSVDQWRFGELFCTAHFLLDFILCTASIFNLTCVALDRYLAVCDPLHYPARMSAERVAKLLLVSWLVPIAGSCLLVAAELATENDNDKTSWVLRGRGAEVCFPEMRAPYAVLASILSFFLPMSFIVVAYGRIFLEAQRQARQIQVMEAHVGLSFPARGPSVPPVQPGLTIRRDRKASQILGSILGGFLLCWLPFFTVNVGNPFWRTPVSPWVLECVLWLGYANSALNPLLYAFTNRALRRAVLILLSCGILGQQDSCLEPGASTQMRTELETVTR